MWTLLIFGDNVEDRMGHARFFFFYLLMGICAGLTHWFTNLDSTVPTVGASGAIAGVLGAYFVLFPTSRIIVLLPIFFFPLLRAAGGRVSFRLFFGQIVSGTFATFSGANVGGIAWWAHAGGFVCGAVFHRLFVLRNGRGPRRLERDEYGLEGAWRGPLLLTPRADPKG